jgi:fluoroquinolone resistance protein
MEDTYFQDQTFNRTDYLAQGEYENCTFTNCYLAEANLSGCKFIDCKFEDSNLSLVQLLKTVFRDVQFHSCKMVGMDFEKCSEYGLSVSFEHCMLESASFRKTKINKTVFVHCSLINVDFTEADLSEAVFEDSDLLDAYFENTMLQKANFTTAYNYTLDPDANRIKKARFSSKGLEGLLRKYDIIIEKVV